MAKINRSLRILGKRDDGFHEIFTEFQTISLADEISFAKSLHFLFASSDDQLPTDERNLIVKAANALKKLTGTEKGAEIYLDKRIPHPGGLGGGSSNAAITILGLAKLWGLKVEPIELVSIGAKLGADIPFFFYGGSAFGTGIGTELFEAPERLKQELIVCTPNIEIPTSDAFRDVASIRLTKTGSKSILRLCRNYVEAVKNGGKELGNDFEKSVFEREPELRELKEMFYSLGARSALLSGSGASVFGVFENAVDRDIAIRQMGEKSRKFSAETISREEYRSMLAPCEGLLPSDLPKFDGA